MCVASVSSLHLIGVRAIPLGAFPIRLAAPGGNKISSFSDSTLHPVTSYSRRNFRLGKIERDVALLRIARAISFAYVLQVRVLSRKEGIKT